MNRVELVEALIDFQLFLESEGYINNHEWDFEEKAIKFQYYKEKQENEERKKVLTEMMQKDEELGLYNDENKTNKTK